MNIHERRAIRSYGKIADDYDNSSEGRFTLPFNRRLAEVVQVPDGGRLLDVACGNGRLLGMLLRGRRFEGYGTDISEAMVRVAQRELPAMAFRSAPADDLPFGDGFFDAVTVCTAFHHFHDVTAFAREVRRVLVPGGRLYIAEIYQPWIVRVAVNPFIRLHPSGDVRLYSPGEMCKLLFANGFAIEPTIVEGNIQIVTAKKL